MTTFRTYKSRRHDLRERLENCEIIARLGPHEPQGSSHVFSDLEGYFHTFLYGQLPRLADPSVRGEQLEKLLVDIREEFRHILCLIEEQRFFRAMEPSHDWQALVKNATK